MSDTSFHDLRVTQIRVEISEASLAFQAEIKSISPIGSQSGHSFNTVFTQALIARPRETLEAVATFERAIGDVFLDKHAAYSDLNRQDAPSSSWVRVQAEAEEAMLEVGSEAAHMILDISAHITGTTGKAAELGNKIALSLSNGDLKSAGGFMAEALATVVHGYLLKVGKSGVEGGFRMGWEVLEGLGETALEALIVEHHRNNPGGGSGDYIGPSSIVDPGADQTGSSSTPDADRSVAADAIVDTAVTTQEVWREQNPEGDPTGEQSSEDPSEGGQSDNPGGGSDDPGGGGGSAEPEAPFGGTTTLVKTHDGQWLDTSTGRKYSQKELEDLGVQFDENGDPVTPSSSSNENETSNDSQETESDNTDAEETAEETADAQEDTGEEDTEGYTPGYDDGYGAPITAEQAAAAAARVSSDNLKLYDESYTGPSPVGDEAQAFGEQVDTIKFNMVSRPTGPDDEPEWSDDVEGSPPIEPEDLWKSDEGFSMVFGGDPMPFDPLASGDTPTVAADDLL